jgi:hypothetical protein
MRVGVVLVVIAALGLTAGDGSAKATEPRGTSGSADRLELIGGRSTAAVIVSDDFERASLGSNWRVHFGSAGIVGGSDLGLLSGTFALLSRAASGPRDQFSEAQVSANADKADKGVFVRRRASDAARYQLHYDTNGTDADPRPHWQIKYDGVPTAKTRILASNFSARAPVPGDVLRIEAEGREIRGYLNGKLVLSARDAAIPAGTAGVALLKLGGVTAPTAIFERWLGGSLPRIVEFRRSGSLVLDPTRRPACFSVRFVSNTRSRHAFSVTNAQTRVVWRDIGVDEAGRPTVIEWCGRRRAKGPTQGKQLPAGRYRAKLQVSVAPVGELHAPTAFFARTWSLDLRK